jgi:pSer/pThr/pTyr-binding forkhead associated (FHA) protein
MPIKVFLTVTEGASKGTTRDFSEGSMVVGRGKVELALFDKKVSNQHCKFSVEGEDCWLEDLKSTNGTFLAGRRVESKIKLQNLDEVVVGLSKISVAIVEQMTEFKKANLPVHDTSHDEASVSKTVPEVSMAATRKVEGEPEIPSFQGEYRQTAVTRIENLISDEMKTFSQWDHPNIAEDNGAKGGVVPRVKVDLVKQKGAEGLSHFTLTKPVSTIGRKGVDIKLNDLDCSRCHAQIEILGGIRVFVKDLGSTNGTFVNGKRVTTQELNSGDIIQVGQTFFEVKIESESS